ncbi:MAG: hypothetical protein ACI9Z9_003018, partial [Litorivivens sp.]
MIDLSESSHGNESGVGFHLKPLNRTFALTHSGAFT